MNIRHMNLNDWEKFWDLRLDFLKIEPQASSYSYEIDLKKTDEERQEFLRELFEEESAIFWIAEDGDRFIGMVGGIADSGPKQKHIAIVISVFVRADYRGQGIAKKLLGSLLEELENNNRFAKINLDVTTTQTSAIKLYESFGFEKVGMWKMEYYVDGKYYDVYEMEKYLIERDIHS